MEENLKIVELKRGRKKVNKALRWKIYDMCLATMDVFLVCDSLKKYMDNKNIFDLLYACFMTFCYAGFLYFSRFNTETIENNLDKDIELEDLLEKEELSK